MVHGIRKNSQIVPRIEGGATGPTAFEVGTRVVCSSLCDSIFHYPHGGKDGCHFSGPYIPPPPTLAAREHLRGGL